MNNTDAQDAGTLSTRDDYHYSRDSNKTLLSSRFPREHFAGDRVVTVLVHTHAAKSKSKTGTTLAYCKSAPELPFDHVDMALVTVKPTDMEYQLRESHSPVLSSRTPYGV